jgi:hypothetical protein
MEMSSPIAEGNVEGNVIVTCNDATRPDNRPPSQYATSL